MTRIAINGMGRIGRAAFKQIIEDGTLELAAVNDLVPAEELAYLLKHDSVYGRYERDVRAQNGCLLVNDGQSCVALNQKSLDKLPWRDLAVDIVLECTGMLLRKRTSSATLRPAPSTSSSPRRSKEATFPPSFTASTVPIAARTSSRAPAARRTASHL